jgi:hypothetical protein
MRYLLRLEDDLPHFAVALSHEPLCDGMLEQL